MSFADQRPDNQTSSSQGQKVTTDPATQNDPKNENPGTITSDSLAAESIQEGGSFAATSDSRGVSAQPSHSTTTNTTDTSSATKLDPAVDAQARQTTEEWSENAQLNAGSNLGKDAGRGPTFNTAGGVGGGVSDATNQADSAAPRGQDLPKGQNISEGGFDSDAPNASFNTDIGGKDDPGRRAIQQMDVPSSGGGPRQEEVTNDGQYDALENETSS